MTKYQRGPVGEPAIIRQLCSRLLETYDAFINEFDGRVDYIDGLMAAHNFHCYVVENLVQETGKDVWYQVARDTFAHRMDAPGEFDTKGTE